MLWSHTFLRMRQKLRDWVRGWNWGLWNKWSWTE